MDKLHLEIVTPQGQIFNDDVSSVVLPGSEGEFGVLPNHASLISLLKAGIIDIEHKNKKHDVVAIQVYDPRAKEMPDVGLMKVVDAETGHEMYIDTHDARLRKVHNKYWEEREIRLHEMLTQSHVDSVAIATDEDYVKMLMTLFSKRNR